MKILKDGESICTKALRASTILSRMVGLLGKNSFGETDGLLLSPCSQIHSIGMRFEFDALYLDKNLKVIKVYENIRKNRILPYNITAKIVLELPSGTITDKGIKIGDILEISK